MKISYSEEQEYFDSLVSMLNNRTKENVEGMIDELLISGEIKTVVAIFDDFLNWIADKENHMEKLWNALEWRRAELLRVAGEN